MGKHSHTPGPSPSWGRIRPRWRQPGQAITEFAVVLPVAVVILALAATGGEMVMTDIGLTQAARAGAIAAAHDAAATPPDSIGVQTTDARTAANNEQGGVGSIQCSGAVPSGCVSVVDMKAGVAPLENRVVSLVQVRVWETIMPFVPIFGNVTIQAEATAPQ
ncbi:MAG: TadE/TadG family type IV pilus assembly protein [Candidatus Dormibacteria bacterium]|jgi:Flp pilus assembly protein TadG